MSAVPPWLSSASWMPSGNGSSPRWVSAGANCRSTAPSAPHTIAAGDLLIIPDLTVDPRTIENPLVTGAPAFRFYAGAVIRGAQGIPLGALCVLDQTPRPDGLDSEQKATLTALARQISSLLDHRRTLAQVAAREVEIAASERRFRVMTAAMPQMVWTTQPDGFHDYYNDRWYEFTGVPYGSTDGAGWNDMFHPDDQERAWARWRHFAGHRRSL